MCSSYCLHCGKNRAESRFPQMQSTLISTGASDDTWPSFAMQCWHTIYQSNGTSWQPLIAASVACNLQTTRIRVTQTQGEEDTCVINFSCFAYVLIIFWILSLWTGTFPFWGKTFQNSLKIIHLLTTMWGMLWKLLLSTQGVSCSTQLQPDCVVYSWEHWSDNSTVVL